jgi:thymidylate synthase ThyX
MSFIWKVDLHNLFHFLKLRIDHHAQYEIRVFADAIYEMIQPIFPIACESFNEYMLHAVSFGKTEIDIIKEVFKEYDLLLKQSYYNSYPNGIKDFANSKGLKGTRLNDFLKAVE